MNLPRLTVAVLAYDEAENIGPVLAELGAWLDTHLPDTEVLVVDDGSSDATADLAREALEGRPGRVLRHPTNRGMGAGLKTAAGAARAPWVTFLPADGQIPPAALGALWDAREGADIVLSVYANRDDGWHREVLSWGVRALIRAVHGVRIESEGPYLFRRSLLQPTQLRSDSFFLNFEFPIRAAAAGLALRTVTIPCRPRLAGRSKTARPGRVVQVAKELVELRRRRLGDALARMR